MLSKELLVPTDSPQPPQELISILRDLATCVLIEETYDADLELDGLYTAREEILRELEDSLEIHL